MEHANARGCYKVILDCSEDNIAFYQKCGLERKEVQMVSECFLCTSLCFVAASAVALRGFVLQVKYL